MATQSKLCLDEFYFSTPERLLKYWGNMKHVRASSNTAGTQERAKIVMCTSVPSAQGVEGGGRGLCNCVVS